MDKVNSWILGLAILLNVVLVVALAAVVTSGPFRSSTPEETVRLLTQLGMEIRDGKKSLSQSEQARLVGDFQFVAKARAEVEAAGKRLIWNIVGALMISLVLLAIVFYRMWRDRSMSISAEQVRTR
jgi:hypothetical protein